MSHYKPGPWTLNGKPTNAHLLDAAADLYEALYRVMSQIDPKADTHEIGLGNILNAFVALAKARGEK